MAGCSGDEDAGMNAPALSLSHLPGRRRRWTADRSARLQAMWPSSSVAEIAVALGTSRGAIYVQAAKLGLTARRKAPVTASAAPSLPPRDPTGQRRFVGLESENGHRIDLKPWHPALRKGSTLFGKSVKPAAQVVTILKSGENSRKLGSLATKGRWKGMPIFGLTLEERDTCPRTCREWATCYGNSMHWAERILDDGTLTRRLWGELASLNARHPAGFIVRLHILGDFYSPGYVAFWRQAIDDFPALRIFGFTARQADDPIGAEVAQLLADQPDRFRIRFSGAAGDRDAAEVVDSPEQATGILCPAQRDPARCCATCGLCWQTNRTISFVRH